MVYQLAKTSVGLTGQVKWDIVLNNQAVSELHIVPIHNNIPYIYRRRKDTTNYTHLQNVKSLYEEISSKFFEPVIRPELNTGYPIRNKGEWLDTREFSYDMHLGRIPYKRYNKQFEFFCPIWVDNKEDLAKLEFRLVIAGEYKSGTTAKQNILYDQAIDLTRKINGSKTFAEYLAEYADLVGLNEDLAYIDMSKSDSWIKGVNVKSGNLQTKNIPSLIYNLLSTERPLLDTDNLILSQFADHNIICTQLLNLNFVFNIDDVVPINIYKQLLGSKLNMYVDVYKRISDSSLEKVVVKDLYSNYDFIPRYDCKNLMLLGTTGTTGTTKYSNCLDYLGDNKSVKHIHNNRLVQSTFHWSLKSNNDYIFNLYNGFSPVYDDESMNSVYADVPVTTDKQFVKKHNPYTWCNINYIGDLNTSIGSEAASLPDKQRLRRRIFTLKDSELTRVQINNSLEYLWLHSLLVDNIKLDKTGMNDIENIYISSVLYGVVSSELDWKQVFVDDYEEENDYGNRYCVLYELPKNSSEPEVHILFCKRNDGSYRLHFIYKKNSSVILDSFRKEYSFVNIRDNGLCVGNYIGGEGVLKGRFESVVAGFIHKLMKSVTDPKTIYINKSVYGKEVQIPQLSSYTDRQIKEIDYYKYYNDVYICRYDGNICPTFISVDSDDNRFNNIYTVKQYDRQINYTGNYTGVTGEPAKSDSGMSTFNDYMFTKFLPVYPSIEYDSQKQVKLDTTGDFYLPDYIGEKKWYKNNKLIYLPEIFIITTEKPENDTRTVDQFISDIIFDYLVDNKILTSTERGMFDSFILPLYKYKYVTTYKTLKNIKEYKYTIQVYLK